MKLCFYKSLSISIALSVGIAGYVHSQPQSDQYAMDVVIQSAEIDSLRWIESGRYEVPIQLKPNLPNFVFPISIYAGFKNQDKRPTIWSSQPPLGEIKSLLPNQSRTLEIWHANRSLRSDDRWPCTLTRFDPCHK